MTLPKIWLTTLCALLFLPAFVCAQSVGGLKPFTIDHRAGSNSLIDLSFLLDAPAGKNGFIRVEKGHLVKPDGKRIRFWGVNLTD